MSRDECTDEVCITCGDVAVRAVVTSVLDDDLALVDAGAGVEEVSIALVDASVGDIVLVHAGEAIAVERAAAAADGAIP